MQYGLQSRLVGLGSSAEAKSHKWNNGKALGVVAVCLVLVVPPWVLFLGRASWLLLDIALDSLLSWLW